MQIVGTLMSRNYQVKTKDTQRASRAPLHLESQRIHELARRGAAIPGQVNRILYMSYKDRGWDGVSDCNGP